MSTPPIKFVKIGKGWRKAEVIAFYEWKNVIRVRIDGVEVLTDSPMFDVKPLTEFQRKRAKQLEAVEKIAKLYIEAGRPIYDARKTFAASLGTTVADLRKMLRVASRKGLLNKQ